MKRILVTGGAGFIGSHTVVELLENNYEVVIVDNLYNSNQDVLKNIKLITNKEFLFYNIDILEEKKLEKVFWKMRFVVLFILQRIKQ